MSKSLGNSLLIPEVLKRVRGSELRYYMVAAHYRSHVEFSFEALDEAAKAYRRIEDFLDRAASVVGSWFAALPDAFVAAMDDDLGTPAAVAVIHDSVRDGNRLLAEGPSEALSQKFGEVSAMLDVLGLNPADEAWAGRGSDDTLTDVVDALVRGLLAERAAAREAKEGARAGAIRDKDKHAGPEVGGTPAGPRGAIGAGSR
jgi:cysteinyl-tRNA synthetase